MDLPLADYLLSWPLANFHQYARLSSTVLANVQYSTLPTICLSKCFIFLYCVHIWFNSYVCLHLFVFFLHELQLLSICRVTLQSFHCDHLSFGLFVYFLCIVLELFVNFIAMSHKKSKYDKTPIFSQQETVLFKKTLAVRYV